MPESSWWSKPALNSFASVIGFKKKQRPSLAIQDPPSQPSSSPVPVRPSLARSRVDSTGPLTPVDYECHSLLSLPDSDPFGRPLIIPQISSKNTPDTAVIHGISCPSSSSLSTSHACDPSVLSPSPGFTESNK